MLLKEVGSALSAYPDAPCARVFVFAPDAEMVNAVVRRAAAL
jgi:hypothetical protein